ncbi:alcohol dehydrogenase catalytic domain-containing protein [bacterium]|nr:alcohol dehydrogenase catalytic domain-containing protein [bacterium]
MPKANPGELIVRIEAALTCGTDLKTYRRGHPNWPTPTPFGHEFSGVVHEVGEGVTQFKVGQPVMIAPTAPCGKCRHCQRGYGNLCDYTMETMMLGAYAEYIRVPEHIVPVNVFPKPDNLSYLESAALEPLSCVVYGDEQLTISEKDTVVIIGAGPIGLLYLMVTQLHHPKSIIMVGRRKMRLDTARSLGADVVIDCACTDYFDEVMRLTQGRGADVVIECTGSPEVWEKSIDLACRGGQVMLFGGCRSGSEVHLPMDRVLRDGLTIKGAFHYTPSAAKHARDLLVEGRINVKPLITDTYSLEEYKTIFNRLDSGDVIKLGVDPRFKN